MRYKVLVDVYEALDATTKRLEKTDILSDFFSRVEKDLLPVVTIMALGKVFPVWSENELGIGSKLLMKSIAMVVGVTTLEVEDQIRDQGDIGSATEILYKKRYQTTFFSKPLTIEMVYNNLRKLAKISGNKAQSRKIDIILELLSLASPQEAKYITRTVLEELRVGVGEGTIRDSISQAFGVDKKLLERAHMLTNDLGMVAKVAHAEGEEGLKSLSLKPGKPVKPMLAQLADGIKETVLEMGRIYCETKYDGIRVQIHRKGSQIMIFTRRLENISNALPDVIQYIEKALPHHDFIVEGEIIVTKQGKPISFQYILQRVRRKYDIEKVMESVPLTLYLFDVLYYKEPLLDAPLEIRRENLESMVKTMDNQVELSKQVKVTRDNVEDAENLFKESIELGHEGIMLKDPQAPYIPGIRGKKMLKYKAEPESLDLVVVGGTYGKGKRAHWIGSYLLALNDEDGELKTIAHVATGLDEKTLLELSNIMEELAIERRGRQIKVKPHIILEISYSEIVKSPEYESGYSLRFPVVKRIRDDLSIEDIDTVARVDSMFKRP
ncbi:MAG: ATP-dependent DNA ligase [Euryarchaeota archaeon]|nr:ATP-dependent DNA ligase [Euryarchaeota archaeon]MBV1730502.1 ATP-dependent DNA ligase [Methanobacterium sp.]MBU4547848.1 ATP-dependent DNA ligase [Euryarchaeota archaeon]MBU4606985.1 ATP-dependent DNA ligase [Euryarchaeota archaeon]MBV1754799.1 ATP-dependent DNA ligase [Methanobacterium sp.]